MLTTRNGRLGAGLLTVCCLLAAGSAQAATHPAETSDVNRAFVVPLHQGATKLTLLGLSESGAVVHRDPPFAETTRDGVASVRPTVLTGALGERLTRRTDLEGDDVGLAPLVGSTQPWTRDTEQVTELHRMDIRTGADVRDGTVPKESWVTFTGSAWIVIQDPDSDRVKEPATIDLYPLTSAPGRSGDAWTDRRRLVTLPVGTHVGSLAVDSGTIAYSTYALISDDNGFSVPQTLQLLDLDDGSARELYAMDNPMYTIGGLRLGRTTVAWTGSTGNLGSLVAYMPRSGGEVTYHGESVYPGNPHGRPRLEVTDDGRIAYLIDLTTSSIETIPGTVVRILHDGKAQDVPVSEDAYGLVASGNDLYTAIGGTVGTAGVYRLDGLADEDDARTRVATVSSVRRALRGWSFEDGFLTWADHAAEDEYERKLYQRYIALEDGHAQVWNERPLVLKAGIGDPDASPQSGPWSPPFVVTSDRAAVQKGYVQGWFFFSHGMGYPDSSVHISPSGVRTGSVEVPPKNLVPQISGKHLLLAGQVFTPDGKEVLREPVAARLAGQDELDGTRLVYGLHRADREPARGEVWLADLSRPGERTKVVAQVCEWAPQVAVFGSSVAWANCQATQITVKNLRTGATRTFATGYRSAGPAESIDLMLGRGVLGWVAGGKASLVDLAASAPVLLPQETRAMALDGGVMVREVARADPDAPWGLVVESVADALG